MERVAAYGAGGFVRRVRFLLERLGLAARVDVFYGSDVVWRERQVSGFPVLQLSRFEFGKGAMIIAIGSPRECGVTWGVPPVETWFPTLVQLWVSFSRTFKIGTGNIVRASVVWACDTGTGLQAKLNRYVSVRQDSAIEDFAILAPGKIVSGSYLFGRGVYLGAAARTWEKLAVGNESAVARIAS